MSPPWGNRSSQPSVCGSANAAPLMKASAVPRVSAVSFIGMAASLLILYDNAIGDGIPIGLDSRYDPGECGGGDDRRNHNPFLTSRHGQFQCQSKHAVHPWSEQSA